MNIATLRTSVYTVTGRPDRVDETNLAIQTATLELHGMENWWRDKIEQQVDFSASSNYQQIPLSNLVRFRTFSYLRKFDPAGTDPLTGVGTGAPGDFFIPLQPDKILDRYGQTEDNIYYLSGGGLTANAVAQLRSTVAFQNLLIGWMQFPQVDDLTQYQSWIAELFPWAIIHRAAQLMKKYVQDSDQVKLLDQNTQLHIGILLTNGLEFHSR
jgi:hypothetical protein